MKILVIQQKMIGDVLASTVIGEALRNRYPEATIHFLINSNTIPVVVGNPFFDEIIEFKKEYREQKVKFYNFLKTIRSTRYTLVIDVINKLESNLISWYTGAPKRIAFYKWYTRFFYTETIERRDHSISNASAAIENRLRLVYASDQEVQQNLVLPKIFLSEAEKNTAKTYLEKSGVDLNRPLLMISVLGSMSSKTYPTSYMATTLDFIIDQTQAQLLFNYLPHQKADAETIYKRTQATTRAHINFKVFGQSLREFLAILHFCDMLIGNEGGAVNMAKALDKPTFTIFSPWIKKEEWNMFEDGEKHDSAHLLDYHPELYGIKRPKEYKERAEEFYQYFKPDLFKDSLRRFLLNN